MISAYSELRAQLPTLPKTSRLCRILPNCSTVHRFPISGMRFTRTPRHSVIFSCLFSSNTTSSPTDSAPPNLLEMPAVNEKNQRPSVPPSPKPGAPAPIVLPDQGRSTRHVKYASIDPPSRKPSAHKTHARRRTDRDQPHSLLTPPLTPSSSIRTSASISTEYSATSTAHFAHELAKNVDIVDPDPEATRILVVSLLPLLDSF